MAEPAVTGKQHTVASRLGSFIADRYPFALNEVLDAFDRAGGPVDGSGEAALDALRGPFRRELAHRLQARPAPRGLPDSPPSISAAARLDQAHTELIDACDGFLRRAAIQASLTADERREMLRGMILTR